MTGGKYIRKLGMTLFVYCLLSGVAHAECVPYPDCASIGYTETSCETQAVKCPFDASKLFCLPCDSSYKYTCSGDNITGGSGTSCGGLYESCTCASGYEWDGSTCKQSCTVGMIYYSDKSCSSTYDSSKTAIGVVVKDNELVLSQMYGPMGWGTFGTDLSLTNYGNSTDVKDDFNGKSNTATIIAEDSGAVAAKYCNDYTTAGTRAGDWYLPAAGELYSYVYGNISVIINTVMTLIEWSFGSAWLWSSAEYSYEYAWIMHTYNGRISEADKDFNAYVSCLLEIN